jgi:23S rRNA (adenine2503-C2)-methyltransferase
MPVPLVGLELNEIKELIGDAQPAYRSRQIYHAIYRQRLESLADATNLPAGWRRDLASRLIPGIPETAAMYESKDGTRRYLLRLADGKTVEAVWMPEQRRSTLCISTQAGCPVDCRFCLTAQMGFERNLTAGEIVGQVLRLAAGNRLDPRDERVNVVMMGQGEPLLNLNNVLKACRLLTDPAGIGISVRRITVSTAGIIPKIAEYGEAPERGKLAISLNASTEEQRRELMPITRKYPLKDLLEACRRYPLRPWERLTFEYVLLKGVNDSEADARRVVRLLSSLKCKVNLIALNPGQGIPFETPDEGAVLAFQSILRRAFPCFIRKPRGRDIFAACGQLKRMDIAEGLVPAPA